MNETYIIIKLFDGSDVFSTNVTIVDSFLSFLLKYVSFSPAHPRFAHHHRTSTNENHFRSMVRLGLTELKGLIFSLSLRAVFGRYAAATD